MGVVRFLGKESLEAKELLTRAAGEAVEEQDQPEEMLELQAEEETEDLDING